jgi:hypothetical protein
MDTLYYISLEDGGKITPLKSEDITKTVGSPYWAISSIGKLGIWVKKIPAPREKREESKPSLNPSFPDLSRRSDGLNLNPDIFYGGYSWNK